MWETPRVRRRLLLVLALGALLLLVARRRRARAREAIQSDVARPDAAEETVMTSTGVAAAGQVEKQEEPPTGPPESPGTTAPSL